MKTVILDHTRIERTLKRIAYQIVEQCHDQKSIVLIGIKPRGVWVAERLIDSLEQVSHLKVHFESIGLEELEDLNGLKKAVAGQHVVLVDDVLNSGRTMMHCASAIMQLEPKAMYTGSLVDRKHRRFPIHSDFTGLSLATTLQEHIQLVIKPKPTIYLE